MNPAEIEIEAGKVIEEFHRHHNGCGVIGVIGYDIVMLTPDFQRQRFQSVQSLTPWQMQNGLTASQWEDISIRLLQILEGNRRWTPPQKP